MTLTRGSSVSYSRGGSVYIPIQTNLNTSTQGSLQQPSQPTTATTCWERLQCYVSGPTHSMELIEATLEGKYEDCEKILKQRLVNINTQDKETKQTALHYAAQRGKDEFVQLLLQYNANCNIQDSLGNTPLHLSIKEDKNNCSKILLECDKLKLNLANHDLNTPLHLAVKKRKWVIVDKLLDLRPDYNVVDILGNTALHLIAEGGRLDCCTKLLQQNTEKINTQNKDGNTPLHLAVQAGKCDIIALLLQNDQVDCNLQNTLKNTPLHLAVNHGHLDCLTEILNYSDLKIDLPNKDDSTALHCAIKTGNSEIVALLLSHHANCNAKDSSGDTSLHVAATKGELDCCQKLLSCNDLKINEQNSSGDTPLHLAATRGHLDCCQKLLDCNDLKINKKNTSHEAPLHVAAKHGRRSVCDLILNYPGVTIDIKDKQKQTPLHLATQENNHEVVELLLSKGADWKLRDKYTYMPLHYAAEKGDEKSCKHLVNVLKESEKSKPFKLRDRRTPLILAAKGGHHHCCQLLPLKYIEHQDTEGNDRQDVKYIDLQDKAEKTALFYAIRDDYWETVKFLLRNEADPTIKNQTRTVLHQAAEERADKCLKLLLENPRALALLSEKDKNGNTPLHEAINGEALECVKILLDSGASPTETNEDGMTPLHLAAKKGDPGICSLLLSYDIDINPENKNNETPLHVAAMHGCRDAITILMRKGIRKMAKDKCGCTALHLAADRGHDQVVQFFMKKGLNPNEKNEQGSTALHLAAAKGHLKTCKILVNNAKRLIYELDKDNNLAVDRAFQEQKDDVFVFLIKRLEPKKDIILDPKSPLHKNTLENLERKKRFHKYMHQALTPDHQDETRVVAAEGILDSKWWTAAFFPHQEKNNHNKQHSHSQKKNTYCNNFHEVITRHPSLALKALQCCYECSSTMSECKNDFRLFQDHLCSEAGRKSSAPQLSLTDGQRLMQEHPVSLMVQHKRAQLLDHPITESWLMYLWKTGISFIFVFLLIIEVLYLTSLHIFLDNVNNWAHIQQKCNATQEQFCRLSSLPWKVELALNDTEATQDAILPWGTPGDTTTSLSTCRKESSLWQWIFVVFMTSTIILLEGIYVYGLRAKYWKRTRLMRIVQIILTFLSWLPTGVCGFQYNVIHVWQWHVGIVALLLEWILIIGKFNKLPSLFVFMPVTKHFVWNYIKAFVYLISLLFAFSYIFKLLLSDQAAFESGSDAMMKTIVWLFGDLNYDDTFVEGQLLYPHMTKLMFVAFIIVMGGFIANLAITQPSERLDEFRRDAAFFQKEAQIILLFEMKACFPCLRNQESNNQIDGNETTKKIFAETLLKKIFDPNIMDKNSKSQEKPLDNIEEQVATLINLCKDQREEMKELKQQFNVFLKKFCELSSETRLLKEQVCSLKDSQT